MFNHQHYRFTLKGKETGLTVITLLKIPNTYYFLILTGNKFFLLEVKISSVFTGLGK